MAFSIENPESNASIPTGENAGQYRSALIVLTSLFFMWGFITALNDILIPYLKSLFSLSYLQAMAVNFCFFSAYAIVSYPAGKFVKKVGFHKGIVAGLSIAAFGCLLFVPAAHFKVYALFLAALFVLASGITLLQVSANPFVTILGEPEKAAMRLNLTQAFNSLGTTVAPIFGGVLILSYLSSADNSDAGSAVQLPYLLLAATFFVLTLLFWKVIKLPQINTEEPNTESQSGASAWQHKHLVLGAIGIFVYVGAEVSVGSFLINFLGESHIAGITEHQAAKYVSIFWGGAMVGRFVGAALMTKIAANKLLVLNSFCVFALLLVTILAEGQLAMWAILSVGFFNSIMFPTIFSLALNRLGLATSQGSGILCLAIVGGAFIPLLQGAAADIYNVQFAFIVPLVCYLYIGFYGFTGYKYKLNKA
ncbi:sugar MFS transporter [Catenovulum maritimum]|uniref:Major facilitator transporter n=1 Tax=Catenovulum maritimum TaxID=1513271 RepID=A0A0J8GU65_9ALTE|nr:sugar MFS transporter [Catenovulum maritimum]KMT64228.1 major facilitator transporter [Catenovulum maritimum]